MYLLLNFILQYINLLTYILIMFFALTPKRSRVVSIVQHSLICFFLLYLKFHSYDDQFALQVSIILLQLELLLFPFIETQNTILKKGICVSIVNFNILISESLSLFILDTIASYTYALEPNTKEFFIAAILSFSVQMILSITFLIIWKYLEYKNNFKNLLLFSLIPMLQLFLNTGFLAPTILNDNTTLNVPLLASCSIISLVVSITLLYYILRHHEKQSIQAAYLELQEIYHMESEYYQELETRHEELSKIRHDYNNQLSTLYMLISSGQIDAAKDLADSIKKHIK